MPKINYTRNAQQFGTAVAESEVQQKNAGLVIEGIRCVKAVQSTGWTKTNSTSGTLTLPAGHGFGSNRDIFLFWDGGQAHGVTGSVSGGTVPITGVYGGDVLPASSTTIVCGHMQALDLNLCSAIDQNSPWWCAQFTNLPSSDKAAIAVYNEYPSQDSALSIFTGEELKIVDVKKGDDSVFTGITGFDSTSYAAVVHIVNGSLTTEARFNLQAILDATPSSSS